MDAEAYAWGEHWYKEHWQRPVTDNNNMAGYRARKQTHLHKLAMVLAAAQRSETVVRLEDLIAADKIITALEPTMPEVFSAVSDSREVRCAGIIVKLLRRHKVVEKSAAWCSLFQVMSYEEFGKGVNAAVAAGHVRELASSNGVFLHLAEVGPPLGTPDASPVRSESPASVESPDDSAA